MPNSGECADRLLSAEVSLLWLHTQCVVLMSTTVAVDCGQVRKRIGDKTLHGSLY